MLSPPHNNRQPVFRTSNELSATKLFISTLLVIIIVEVIIMTVFNKLFHILLVPVEAFINGFLLLLILFPLLYKLVFTPLVQRIRECQDAEIALRESEEKYRHVVDNSKEVIFQADVSGAWSFLNKAWEDITGFSIEESIGKNLLGYVCEEDKNQFISTFRMFINNSQDAWHQQVRFRNKTGDYRWVEINARQVNNSNGEISINGVIHDITESKLVMDSLKRRDDILHTISFSAELFMRLQNLDVSIIRVLERIGLIGGFKSVFVSECQHNSAGSIVLVSTHKWRNVSAASEEFESNYICLNLEEYNLGRWLQLLKESNTVCTNVKSSRDFEVDFLRDNNILWIALVPIFVGSEFWGVIGFDKDDIGTELTEVENDALKLLANLIGSTIERRRYEDVIRNMAEGVSAETDGAYFAALCSYLAETLKVELVYIGEILHDNFNNVQTVQLLLDEPEVKEIQIEINTSLVNRVIDHKGALFIDAFNELYPEDPIVKQFHIKSFIGTALFDSNGMAIGLIVMMSLKPFINVSLVVTLIKVFASRSANELERRRANRQISHTNQQLEERKNFIESVIANIQSGIIVTDPDFSVNLVNPYARNVMFSNFPKPEGRSLSLVCPEIYSSLSKGFESDELSIAYDTHIGYKCFDIRLSDGSLRGYIITFIDLTEIIKTRHEMRTKERLATMGEVVARVAHEMRNPLFGITAAAQILSMEIRLTPPQKELMNSLFHEAKRMNKLVEDLLDCSKEVKLNIKQVDLVKLINESIGFNEVFLLEKRLTVERSLPNHEVLYDADPERLKQVVLNLFKNSIDASHVGGKINVSLDLTDSIISIAVRDSGDGVSTEIMDKIFDVFFTTKKNGTGLGLYICRKVIDAHGGILSMSNNNDCGVTFTVTLPLARGNI